jgi:hypothetical protein
VTIPDPANPTVNITYTSYRILSGSAISGDKIATGYWAFGSDPSVIGNPANNIANAPLSFTTNDKYNFASGTLNPSVAQKYAALIPADIITKEILTEQIADALDFLEIDNGFYYYENSSGVYTCNNYSVPGSTPDPLSVDFICGT